jgi:uncharacterized protein YbaR (Trm112 family)
MGGRTNFRDLRGFRSLEEGGLIVDAELLSTLVCPETRTRLHLADEALVAQVNRQAAAGRLTNRIGRTVEGRIEAGLIREDGRFLYPIVDGIPVMLIDESIPMDSLEGNHS